MYRPFNQEQLDFLQKHHELIVFGKITLKFLHSSILIDKIIESRQYQALFSGYSWDDVVNYYEETPDYDNTLWIELHEQLNAISRKW